MSGLTDFEDNLTDTVKKAGGMPIIVRSNYAKNIYQVMKTFGLTPASPDFYNLTPDQLDFLVLSMSEEAREQELAANHRKEDDFVYDQDFSYEGDMEYGGKKNDEDQIRKLLGEAAWKKREELTNNALEGMSRHVEQENEYREQVKKQSDSINNKAISKSKGISFASDDEDVDTI